MKALFKFIASFRGRSVFWVSILCSSWVDNINCRDIPLFWDVLCGSLNNETQALVSIPRSFPSFVYSCTSRFESSTCFPFCLKEVVLGSMEYDVGQKYLGLSGAEFVAFQISQHTRVTLVQRDRLLAPSLPFADPFIRFSPSKPKLGFV